MKDVVARIGRCRVDELKVSAMGKCLHIRAHKSSASVAHADAAVCRLISVENATSFVSPVLIASAILYAHVRPRKNDDDMRHS